jgi:hypothetical protein
MPSQDVCGSEAVARVSSTWGSWLLECRLGKRRTGTKIQLQEWDFRVDSIIPWVPEGLQSLKNMVVTKAKLTITFPYVLQILCGF